jgi:hypothetical protein
MTFLLCSGADPSSLLLLGLPLIVGGFALGIGCTGQMRQYERTLRAYRQLRESMSIPDVLPVKNPGDDRLQAAD